MCIQIHNIQLQGFGFGVPPLRKNSGANTSHKRSVVCVHGVFLTSNIEVTNLCFSSLKPDKGSALAWITSGSGVTPAPVYTVTLHFAFPL